jgi:hypothetical protein
MHYHISHLVVLYLTGPCHCRLQSVRYVILIEKVKYLPLHPCLLKYLPQLLHLLLILVWSPHYPHHVLHTNHTHMNEMFIQMINSIINIIGNSTIIIMGN